MLERNLELENDFFDEKFYFSYSSLQKLINDPKRFYKEYILGEFEDGDKTYFKEGALFHCFILEPENFNDLFYINSIATPSGSSKDIVNYIFNTYAKVAIEENPNLRGSINLGKYENEILAYMKEIDVYQGLVDAKRADKSGRMLTGDQKRLEKAITKESTAYFKALQEGMGKTVVDVDMIQKAKEKASIVLSHPDVIELLQEGSAIDIRKEQELKIECDDKPFGFGLKGFVDLIRVDTSTKTISIVDFKTTSKKLKDWMNDFNESEYMYWLQPIVYKELIMNYVPKEDHSEWKIKILFPVIDKDNNFYVFPVSPKSYMQWQERAKGVFEIADWHMTYQNFSLPYEFANRLAIL